jgi:DNA-binding transcriptional LysR family regulator
MLADKLQYFLAAARHEHIGQAADELNLSQPALSRSIQKLEEELGVQLFDRTGRGVHLNEAGHVLLNRVKRASAEFEDAVRELAELSSAKRKTISLGYLSTFGIRLIPELVKNYCDVDADVEFKLLEGPSPFLTDQLLKGEIDLCVSSQLLDPALMWRPLFNEELHALLHPGHRLAEREAIDLAELAEDTFVALKPGNGLRQSLDDLCRQAGFIPKIKFEGYEVATLRGLVGSGFGVTLAPKRQVAAQTQAVSVPILTPNCYQVIGLSWRKNRWLSPKAISFSEYLLGKMQTKEMRELYNRLRAAG